MGPGTGVEGQVLGPRAVGREFMQLLKFDLIQSKKNDNKYTKKQINEK